MRRAAASYMLRSRRVASRTLTAPAMRHYASTSASGSAAGDASGSADTTSSNGRTTHFGYQTVPEEEKERLVGHVFESVASQYDLMNDVMSAGVHRLWKDTMVGMIGASALGAERLQVLDVAGGTGDIAFRIADDVAAAAAPPAPRVPRRPPTLASMTTRPPASSCATSTRTCLLRAAGAQMAASRPSATARIRHGRCTQPIDDCSFDVTPSPSASAT